MEDKTAQIIHVDEVHQQVARGISNNAAETLGIPVIESIPVTAETKPGLSQDVIDLGVESFGDESNVVDNSGVLAIEQKRQKEIEEWK